jgi:integrase/recombinase XerD
MFDQLFSLPAVLARHRNAPLAEDRLRFLGHLAELGLSRRSLLECAPLLLVIVEKLDLANRPGVSISQDEIRQKATTKRDAFISFATRWLQFLGRLEQLPPPASRFADKISAFADFMQYEKDLSSVTIHERCSIIQRVLDRLTIPDGSLAAVSVGQIDDALLGFDQSGWLCTTHHTRLDEPYTSVSTLRRKTRLVPCWLGDGDPKSTSFHAFVIAYGAVMGRSPTIAGDDGKRSPD